MIVSSSKSFIKQNNAVYNRRMQDIAILIYKALHNQSPQYIKDYSNYAYLITIFEGLICLYYLDLTLLLMEKTH